MRSFGRLASRSAAALFVILVLAALGYRAVYHIWPGQGAGGTVHWCGRDYLEGTSHQSLAQIKADLQPGDVLKYNRYPPFGPGQPLVAPVVAGAGFCPTVVFVGVGPDDYVGYGLSGGP